MVTRRSVVRSVAVGLPALLVSGFPAAWLANAEQAQPAQSNGFDARDREFLFTIRFANLWEIPTGGQAAQRSSSEKVRDMGRVLVADHTMLNGVVEDLARQFGVDLPDEPTSKQKQWMDEISAASGEEYNRILTDRLRAAHGSVFSLIAEIRAGTRNDTIREFATTANDIVLKHMTLLEGTGYVTMDGMFAEASARTMDNPENQLDGGDIALAGIVGVGAVGATLGLVRTLSAHGTAER